MFPYVAICCLTVEAFGRTFGGGGHCIASFSEILVASQEYFCGRFKPFKQPMRYQWDPNISQWSIRISLRFCVRPQTKYRGRQRLMRFLHIGFSPRLTSFQVQSLKDLESMSARWPLYSTIFCNHALSNFLRPCLSPGMILACPEGFFWGVAWEKRRSGAATWTSSEGNIRSMSGTCRRCIIKQEMSLIRIQFIHFLYTLRTANLPWVS